VVAVSHYTAQVTEQVFGCADIGVILNGVDCRRFFPLERQRPQRPFRLLYVGNWSMRKGVELLAPILCRLGEGFVLHHTADRADSQQFQMPPNAVNLGRISGDELVAAYQEADALLFPTRLEGLPLTALEAMACGTPVIAARVSSLPEVIEHGTSGLLCDTHSVDAFVTACRWLRDHPQQWRAMREQARARVLQRFSLEAMVGRYVEVYDRLLELR
ncbi:MAG: glycosyltransferase family 4 protein, partial [Geminicoccaceae bacterium]|nr:glycosyltransferase family 4 protein [Geminicoccaceae bacterium]